MIIRNAMNRYIAAFFIITSFVQCANQETETSRILSRAESIIEQHPDSSLSILNTLQLTGLPTREEKACYALLKSMALDKNYIDVTDDSLTSIALAYYKKHGSPDEKLKAYYYNGVVCMNDENYEGAMYNYIQAEKFVKDCADYVFVGRLYNAKGIVYKEIFNIEKAIEPAEKSVRYYLKGKDTARYVTALNNLSSMLLAADKFDSLKVCFSVIEGNIKNMSTSQKGNYYINLINYKTAVSDSSLYDSIDEYIREFSNNEKKIRWYIIAKAYMKAGDIASAVWAIDKQNKYGNTYKSNVSSYIASEVYNSIGDYRRAYEHLKEYYEKSSNKDFRILTSDTKFLEERYVLQVNQLKQKYSIIILVLSLMLIIFFCILNSYVQVF